MRDRKKAGVYASNCSPAMLIVAIEKSYRIIQLSQDPNGPFFPN